MVELKKIMKSYGWTSLRKAAKIKRKFCSWDDLTYLLLKAFRCKEEKTYKETHIYFICVVDERVSILVYSYVRKMNGLKINIFERENKNIYNKNNEITEIAHLIQYKTIDHKNK